MPKRRFSTEQIVTRLRQIEVSMAQGKPTPVALSFRILSGANPLFIQLKSCVRP
jgi:hypothetical protein